MEQILIMGVGDLGTSVTAKVADYLISNKIRVNGGRICCASVITKEYTDYVALKGVISVTADDMSAALDTFDENEDGSLNVLVVGALSEADGEACSIAISAVKTYFAQKDLTVTVRGMFVLPDVFADSATLKPAASRNLDELSNRATPLFDAVYFINDRPSGSKMFPDVDSCIASLSRMVYLIYFSPLGEEFALREQDAKDGETLYGMLGLSTALYPNEQVAQYCGCRGSQDIIDKLWIYIDKELSAKFPGRSLPSNAFRKEYISIFERKLNEPESNDNYFPQLLDCVRNEFVTLNADDSESCTYTDKVDDFLCITDRLIGIFSKDKDVTALDSYSAGDADAFISDVKNIAIDISAELMAKALPVTKEAINLKNEASAFGFICNQKGEIPEDPVYPHPVAARYLYYKLLTAVYDERVAINSVSEEQKVIDAFSSGEDKAAVAASYLVSAVKIAFFNAFAAGLEKLVKRYDDFFAALPDVWSNIDKELKENLSDDPVSSSAIRVLSASAEEKATLYESRPLSLNGMTPFGSGIIEKIEGLFFFGEDPFDTVSAGLEKSDPVYSFEYNMTASYKKYYSRHKDATVNFDIYKACGENIDSFKALVNYLSTVAVPDVQHKSESLIWTVNKAFAEAHPWLGDVLGIDVEKFKSRVFSNTSLECLDTVYGVEPEALF